MKFGGTSVADLDRIRHVASLVKQEVDRSTGNITSEFIKNIHAYPKNTEMGKITKVLMDKKEPTAIFGSGTGANELDTDSGLGNHFTYATSAGGASFATRRPMKPSIVNHTMQTEAIPSRIITGPPLYSIWLIVTACVPVGAAGVASGR